MWYLDQTNPATFSMTTAIQDNILGGRHQANNVYDTTKKADLVQFLSAAMWNPVPSTWIQAINAGFFATWPGLTPELVYKHLETTEATTKGHMRATRTNVRSTKIKLETGCLLAVTQARQHEFYIQTNLKY